jgi:hypothetical protein
VGDPPLAKPVKFKDCPKSIVEKFAVGADADNLGFEITVTGVEKVVTFVHALSVTATLK